MSYKRQGLFELSSKFPFGKHKGNSVVSTYSGDASALVLNFMRLISKSFELIFSKNFYEDSKNKDVIDVSGLTSGWAGDNERINLQNVGKLVLAMRDGVECSYEVTPKRIKVEVRKTNGEIDEILSKIGCDIAKEYVTRFFGKISVYGENNFFRPALLNSSEITDIYIIII